MKNTQVSLLGLCTAALLGVALSLSLGASNPKPPAMPRYSTQVSGPFLHITDNETNKMYVYVNKEGQSDLIGTIDLTKTGTPTLKAVKVTNP